MHSFVMKLLSDFHSIVVEIDDLKQTFGSNFLV